MPNILLRFGPQKNLNAPTSTHPTHCCGFPFPGWLHISQRSINKSALPLRNGALPSSICAFVFLGEEESGEGGGTRREGGGTCSTPVQSDPTYCSPFLFPLHTCGHPRKRQPSWRKVEVFPRAKEQKFPYPEEMPVTLSSTLGCSACSIDMPASVVGWGTVR